MKKVKADRGGIREAAELIMSNGVVVYPTDTVYGLGCNPFSEEAVAKLLSIKTGRSKPLPLLASSTEKINEIAYMNKLSEKLSGLWPGALTLVLKCKVKFPKTVTAGLETVAVRIPNHPIALRLIDAAGGVLVGTSVNLTGKTPAISADEVPDRIGRRVDLMLNGGPSLLKVSSTVIDVSNGSFRLIREGALKASELKQLVGSVGEEFDERL